MRSQDQDHQGQPVARLPPVGLREDAVNRRVRRVRGGLVDRLDEQAIRPPFGLAIKHQRWQGTRHFWGRPAAHFRQDRRPLGVPFGLVFRQGERLVGRSLGEGPRRDQRPDEDNPPANASATIQP